MIQPGSLSDEGPWASLKVLERPWRSLEEERRRWMVMVLAEEALKRHARENPIDLIALSGC